VAKDPDLASLVRTAREVNMRKQSWVIDQICATEPKSRSIGCFGLTYKPDVEDLRESPALEIARALQKEGYPVYCCEPNCSEVEGLTLCSLKETLEKSDLLLFLVAHREFRGLSLPPGKRTLDCVGIL
jgi:UDP-N-acetyl-D-mannosaminuronic acid dehydrogenase